MGIESKSSKLVCLCLVSIQKLVVADAIGLEGLLTVVQGMEQVSTAAGICLLPSSSALSINMFV